MSDQRDLQAARFFLLETAISMYIEDGNSGVDAEFLAKALLESPIQFEIPEWFDD